VRKSALISTLEAKSLRWKSADSVLSGMRTGSVMIALCATAGMLFATPDRARAADEESASAFASTRFSEPCDGKNNHLWLDNKHTFKTIVVTLRWHAAGGKVLSDQFFPGPNSSREIGCAAEAEIVEAKFAEF
jgi:hypothetical protein